MQKDVKTNNVVPVQSLIAKASGPVLPHQLPQALSASAPRRTAGSAGLAVPDSGQKFLVVPSPAGKPFLQRLESKSGMELDTDTASVSTSCDASPPPSPRGAGRKSILCELDKSAGGKAYGLRESTDQFEDPVGTFTLLRAEFDAQQSRGRRQERPYMRIARVPLSVNDTWTANFAVTGTANNSSGYNTFRTAQVASGSAPEWNQRVGQAVKIDKIDFNFVFWGITASGWSGNTPALYAGNLATPKHRIVVAIDKWPQLGTPVWVEPGAASGTEQAADMQALFYRAYNDGNATSAQVQKLHSSHHQSPLTKDLRFIILHDKVWTPGTNEHQPAQITVTGNYLYRAWQEQHKFSIHDIQQLYLGTSSSNIFTNDIRIWVMRDVNAAESAASLPTAVTSNFDYEFYVKWQDLQNVAEGGLPQPVVTPAAGAGAAAAAAAK